jgi:signal transduction histidine kinase
MMAVPVRWGNQAVVVALFVALGATMVLAAGLYLRGLDERRERAVVDVRRAERLQLARELHDFVAHHVTGIVVGAQAAQVLAGTDPDRALASLPAIEAAGQQTLASMHRLVGMMRDADGEAAALPGADATALHDLVDDFSRTGLPVRLRIEEEPGRLPPEVVMSAYRIVREALTNARKYAVGATHVDVDIRRTEAGLLVVVRDDGAGGGASTAHRRGGGFGLVGLTERAEAVGGRLHAGRHAGGGWEVTAVLPIMEEVG